MNRNPREHTGFFHACIYFICCYTCITLSEYAAVACRRLTSSHNYLLLEKEITKVQDLFNITENLVATKAFSLCLGHDMMKMRRLQQISIYVHHITDVLRELSTTLLQ